MRVCGGGRRFLDKTVETVNNRWDKDMIIAGMLTCLRPFSASLKKEEGSF